MAMGILLSADKGNLMKSNRKKKVIHTGLEIQTMPVPRDKGMSQEEYEAKVMQIRRDRETQETLNKVAEAEVAKPNARPRVNQPARRPVAPRPQVRQVARVKGLLHPEPQPTPSPYMGILDSLAQTPTKRK